MTQPHLDVPSFDRQPHLGDGRTSGIWRDRDVRCRRDTGFGGADPTAAGCRIPLLDTSNPGPVNESKGLFVGGAKRPERWALLEADLRV